MNLKNYKKLVALSLTGALTLVNPKSVEATQYSQNTVNFQIVPKVKATTNVKLRRYADINSEQVGMLNQNQMLNLKEMVGDWYGVEWQNQIVYVNKNYVVVVQDTMMQTKPIKKVVTTSNAFLFREENYNNIINTIPYNTTLDVYLDTPLYYYVKYNGQLGYIEKTKVLDNNVLYQLPVQPNVTVPNVVPNNELTQNQIINNYYIEQYNQIINNYYNTNGYDYIRKLER